MKRVFLPTARWEEALYIRVVKKNHGQPSFSLAEGASPALCGRRWAGFVAFWQSPAICFPLFSVRARPS